jgi:hypothetical protein
VAAVEAARAVSSRNRKKKFALRAIRSRLPRYRDGQNRSSQLPTPGVASYSASAACSVRPGQQVVDRRPGGGEFVGGQQRFAPLQEPPTAVLQRRQGHPGQVVVGGEGAFGQCESSVSA